MRITIKIQSPEAEAATRDGTFLKESYAFYFIKSIAWLGLLRPG